MQSRLSLLVLSRAPSSLPSCSVGVLPLVLVLLHTLSTLFGTLRPFIWLYQVYSSFLCSRRMMMTSGGGQHYKSMFDAGSQIIAKEGTKSLFKGAGANILRGVAGAGVLSLYDKLQQVMFGKVYSGGSG